MTNKSDTGSRVMALTKLAQFSGAVRDLGLSALGYRADSFENPLTGLNTRRDKVTHARVKAPVALSDWDCADLYRGNIFARRVASALPGLALRNGVRLKHPNAGDMEPEKRNEQIKLLSKAMKRFSVLSSTYEAGTWGRAYGRGAILLGVNGAGSPASPYDPNINPGKLEFITVLEKRDFHVAEVHPDSGLPMLWRLNLPEKSAANILVHDSRFIKFGAELTSSRDRLTNNFADDSVFTVSYEQLRALDTVWNSTVHLVADASQGVFTVKGFFEMLTSQDVGPLLLRLQMMDMARSSVRGVVIDEEEKFERMTTNFTGLPDVLQKAFQITAAAAGMPVTELFGMSPAGLNATGESDTKSWYAKGEQYQRNELLEPLELLVNLVALSEGLPTGWVVEFPSLWTMTPVEEANFRKTVAETDNIEINNQTLLHEEVATHRHSGDENAWTTPVPIDIGARQALVDAQLAMMEKGDPNAVTKPGETKPATGAEPEAVETSVDPELAKDPASALNGAQVAGLKDIVLAVANKELPRSSGIAMILASFPLTKEQAEAIMGEVGTTFFIEAPEAPAPGGFGGGGTPSPFAPKPGPKAPEGGAPAPENKPAPDDQVDTGKAKVEPSENDLKATSKKPSAKAPAPVKR